MCGNYNSKEDKNLTSITRSGSLYSKILDRIKLDVRSEECSGDVVNLNWSKSELDKYLERKGW